MKLRWWLAVAAVCQGQSIQSLTAQIQRSPSVALYVERGAAFLEAGDARQALLDFDRALERDAVHLPALTGRAQAQTRLGRHTYAIIDWSSAIALNPGDAALYLARAAAHAAAGDARRAREDREEASRLTPATAPALVTRAARLRELGLMAEAESDLQRALELDPGNRAAQAALARAVSPPPSTPPPAAPPAAEASTESVDSLYARGRKLVTTGKLAEGMPLLTEAIRRDPRRPVLYNTRGFGYYLQKDYVRAIADFDEALRLNPNYLNAIHNRALAKLRRGDTAGYEADRRRELELERAGRAKR